MTANALAGEAAAYLKSAAHQPVQWQPWSNAAFDRAKREDKPILLDIGAVWCHWCHVMDGESYENEAVARLLNEAFVCIKVDRDERPDPAHLRHVDRDRGAQPDRALEPCHHPGPPPSGARSTHPA